MLDVLTYIVTQSIISEHQTGAPRNIWMLNIINATEDCVPFEISITCLVNNV